MRFFVRALLVDRGTGRVRTRRGFAAFSLQGAARKRCCKRALESRPDDAFVWLGLAHAYVRSGSCELALAPCSKALELDRDLAPGWLELAKVHLCMGALEEALATCRFARTLRPERIHNLDAMVIIGSYGSFRRFEAETYDTESSIYLELSRRMMAETPAGTEHSEAAAAHLKALEEM